MITVFEELNVDREKDNINSLWNEDRIQALKKLLARISVQEDRVCVFAKPNTVSLCSYEKNNITPIEPNKISKGLNIEATWTEYNHITNRLVDHRMVMNGINLNCSFNDQVIIGNRGMIWSTLDFSKERQMLLEIARVQQEREERVR